MGSLAPAGILVRDKDRAISSRNQVERSHVRLLSALAQGFCRSKRPVGRQGLQDPSGNPYTNPGIERQGSPLYIPAPYHRQIEAYGQDRVSVRRAIVATMQLQPASSSAIF